MNLTLKGKGERHNSLPPLLGGTVPAMVDRLWTGETLRGADRTMGEVRVSAGGPKEVWRSLAGRKGSGRGGGSQAGLSLNDSSSLI